MASHCMHPDIAAKQATPPGWVGNPLDAPRIRGRTCFQLSDLARMQRAGRYRGLLAVIRRIAARLPSI